MGQRILHYIARLGIEHFKELCLGTFSPIRGQAFIGLYGNNGTTEYLHSRASIDFIDDQQRSPVWNLRMLASARYSVPFTMVKSGSPACFIDCRRDARYEVTIFGVLVKNCPKYLAV